MKKYFLLLTCVLLALGSAAQVDDDFRTVFKKGEKEKKNWRITGFGGPMMQFTSIDGNFAHLMGGGGAILINDFYFGGYGYGLTNDIPYKNQEEEYNLDFGYGGLWFGYILNPYSPIHFNISAQMGWGNVSRVLNSDFDLEPVSQESVFVLTPILELEFNFSRMFRLGAGASFNYVSGTGVTRTAYTWQDFGKPSVHLSFKFGYFY